MRVKVQRGSSRPSRCTVNDPQAAHDSWGPTERIAPADLTDRANGSQATSPQAERSVDDASAEQAADADPRQAGMMTDAAATQNRGMTSEQLAPADVTDPDDDRAQPRAAQPERSAAHGSAEAAALRKPRAELLDADELTNVRTRWREIRAHFVDEPRSAVQDANALVADLMQRLAQMFAAERVQLKSCLASGTDVSTEDLRQGLQRYRSFFERLLTV